VVADFLAAVALLIVAAVEDSPAAGALLIAVVADRTTRGPLIESHF
jgi:hypothetical protein